MSDAGARVAEDAGVNWLDLSGNASIRAENLLVWVQGRPSAYRSRGRPSSPETGLDNGTVSRVVRRLGDELLLENHGREVRPRDPGLLLDAWADDYRFNHHDVVAAHMTGSGIEVARAVAERLNDADVHHAFTGLSAAWAIDRFARFRMNTVYVEGDPRDAAESLARANLNAVRIFS
jgi:hypothetical protein